LDLSATKQTQNVSVHFLKEMRHSIILLIFVISCGTKSDSGFITNDQQTNSKPAITEIQSEDISRTDLNSTTRFTDIKIEEIKRGKTDPDFWETGLKEIKYKVYQKDSLIMTINISPNDFIDLYNRDFSESSKIWDSEILQIDSKKQRIVIINSFGLPESDNITDVLWISDFSGNKIIMDSPTGCASGTMMSYNKIVSCIGVYDFSHPIIEFKDCCTVYADLINSKTLFYIIDWDDKVKKSKNNAFLINIETKDTLERFRFNDYEMILDYSASIDNNKEIGILAILNSDRNELVTWDTLLNKRTFNLTKLKTDKHLISTSRSIELYTETLGKVIIEVDDKLQPTKWNQ
jgi:hypothetical protein